MSKSLLTAKVVGGGILGTGAVAAGGYGIVEHFKSKESGNSDLQPGTPSITDTATLGAKQVQEPAGESEGQIGGDSANLPGGPQTPAAPGTFDGSSQQVSQGGNEPASITQDGQPISGGGQTNITGSNPSSSSSVQPPQEKQDSSPKVDTAEDSSKTGQAGDANSGETGSNGVSGSGLGASGESETRVQSQ